MPRIRLVAWVVVLLACVQARAGQAPPATQPVQIVTRALARVASIAAPAVGSEPKTFAAELEVTRGEGLPRELRELRAEMAVQWPNRWLVRAKVKGNVYAAGRNGQSIWAHVPGKRFGVVGRPGVARFAEGPDSRDQTVLRPLSLPMDPRSLGMVLLLTRMERRADEAVGGEMCYVVSVAPGQAMESLGLLGVTIEVAVRQRDDLPVRVRARDGRKLDAEIQLTEARLEAPWAEARWNLVAGAGDRIETVAVSHLERFTRVAAETLTERAPALGPAKGERRVVAREGEGRLEMHDGTRVLFVKGTPEEMGRQQGALLKPEIRRVSEKILYGVGVGSSFEKGRWFFGEIEEAQRRLHRHVSPRYWAEMDALADAAGVDRREIRLANVFPELFHCTGFAVMGEATVGGRLYHGRVLDYLRGVGLEQNAVVMVFRPEKGNAWVNVGYAGFVGSVTAMNEKKVAIGEMGGRGEGNWDGKPMTQLVREVMEEADTLEEAVEIMRRGPRTCEYYYVISDGKTRRAVGIRATPTEFETVWPGEPHRQLPKPVKDTVLLSAGSRYETLVERVKGGYGGFDMEKARALMEPPVCMGSNIHSVLFAPETLDLWVANANSGQVASLARYTHYNLGELLRGEGKE